MKHHRGWMSLVALVALSLAVLLGLYVGAYYRMVRPTRPKIQVVSVVRGPKPVQLYVTLEARYVPPRILGLDCESLFAPIHDFDRELRPQQWERPGSIVPAITPEEDARMAEIIDAILKEDPALGSGAP